MINKSYRIHRLFIHNFKLFDKVELNFEGKDLTVLDGPNGYGKTTIFDCIELTLTGKIHRIKQNPVTKGKRLPKNNIFQKKINTPTYIVLELKDKFEFNDSLIIATYLDTSSSEKPKKASNNWGQIKRVQLENYQIDFNDIKEGESIDNSVINSLFGIKDIEYFFNILHYVQQEESLHFLKQKDAERHSMISGLIEIQQEENERFRIKAFEKKLNESIKTLKKRVESNQEKITQLQSLLDEKNEKEVAYFSLFEKLNLGFRQESWDKKIISQISLEQKNGMIKRIEEVQAFFLQKDAFLTNFEIKKRTNSDFEKSIRYLISGWNFRNKKLIFKQKNDESLFLKRVKPFFTSDKIMNHFKEIDIERLQNILSISVNKIGIEKLLREITAIQIREGNFSRIIGELNRQRQNIKTVFKHTIEENDKLILESNCPLCGTYFETKDSLFLSFDTQEKLLQSLIGDNTLRKEVLIRELFTKHINQILEKIGKYLDTPANIINSAFLNQIDIPNNYIENIEKFILWSKKNEILLEGQLNEQYNIPLDEQTITKRTSEIIQRIKKLEKPISDYNSLLNIFSNVFNGKADLIDRISIPDLENKINYINSQFYILNNNKVVSLEEENDKFKGDLLRKELVYSKVTTISKAYKDEIKSYTKRVIKEIEIPFFIYSGRIIQEYENGNGLFIKTFEDRNLSGDNAMIFTSTSNDENDALHSLSSGQLSALVISFMLTLNKIYGDNGLNTILIDDPVHKKYGLNIQRINVKDELLDFI